MSYTKIMSMACLRYYIPTHIMAIWLSSKSRTKQCLDIQFWIQEKSTFLVEFICKNMSTTLSRLRIWKDLISPKD